MVGEPGDQFGGISDGERKLLSIAMELVGVPPVLCLDDPFAGLDAASTSRVAEVLRSLAQHVSLFSLVESEFFVQYPESEWSCWNCIVYSGLIVLEIELDMPDRTLFYKCIIYMYVCLIYSTGKLFSSLSNTLRA